MQPVQSRSRSLLKRIILIGGIVSTATLILAACGGSDSQSQSGNAAGSSLGERLRALAVPPSWKPRVPGPEAVNGITVPPEPAPSVNNATLAGVDSNANGVRDDVERIIAKGSSGQAQFNNTLITAKAYQSILLSPNLTQAEYDTEFLKVTCADLRMIDGLGGMGSSKVIPATFNTDARKQAYKTKVLDNIHARIVDAREECL